MKMTWIMLVMLFCSVVPAWAADQDLADLADDIVEQANRLKKIAYQKTYLNHHTDPEITQTLKQLELLIAACENELRQPIARPEPPRPPDAPRPPHPLGPETHNIGNTSAADDSAAVLYTDAEMRKVPFRKLIIEHLGGARYIRMGEVKVVAVDGEVFKFNAGGGKFYPGDQFEIELPKPAQISEVSILVQHQTTGLQITGQAARLKPDLPTLVDLGVSGGIKDGISSLSLSKQHRRLDLRKLQLRHTGGDEFIRLGNLEVVTNDDQVVTLSVPYGKLRPDDTLEVELPRPLNIKAVRVYVQHRTNGISIAGVQ
ncbi:MAG: hypothetical protein JW709_04930 [Sedimentisphaerales bacterium]|nr:hypothetical protein [Sedimentisphaerales bacterium]